MVQRHVGPSMLNITVRMEAVMVVLMINLNARKRMVNTYSHFSL